MPADKRSVRKAHKGRTTIFHLRQEPAYLVPSPPGPTTEELIEKCKRIRAQFEKDHNSHVHRTDSATTR